MKCLEAKDANGNGTAPTTTTVWKGIIYTYMAEAGGR